MIWDPKYQNAGSPLIYYINIMVGGDDRKKRTVKEFIQFILSKILDDASDITIEESTSEYNEQVYNIVSPKEKIAYLIGKEGRIIQAIRTLSKVLAVKQNLRIRVNVSEKTSLPV